MSLNEEVDEHRKAIRTDGYPMSIGELAAMYKERDLELHPEFQRFFRWSDRQKSSLIESLLLGIPIPSIFVHQRENGVWDVIDGLQRLSAIFEFIGILRNEAGGLIAPLTLQATKYLPSLNEKTWDATEAEPNGLGGALQRVLKRSKLDVKIVLRESDADTRLELFQRLNTGGSLLSAQELRNCQILMFSSSVLDRLRELARVASFQECVALSDRNLDEQYDLELVIRFIVLRNRAPEGIGDLGPFLDDEIVGIARNVDFDWHEEARVFTDTFDALGSALGDEVFRRFEPGEDRFLGGFLVTAFEILALGLGHHIARQGYVIPDLVAACKSFWSDHDVVRSVRGKRAGDRLRTTLPFGRQHLAP